MNLGLLIDLLLITALAGLALQAVTGQTLFRSAVMFIVFGFVMALIWARLNAPDLALAEAAIGAGLTGALVLMAYRRLLAINPEDFTRNDQPPSRLALPVALLSGVLVAGIGWSLLGLDSAPGPAGMGSMDRLGSTGLSNPVTAVLIAFRGYDTLLEMVVLLVAVLATRAVTEAGDRRAIGLRPGDQPLTLVRTLESVMVPLTILVAAYLLQAGGHAPGGAFQAGALLAAAGVVLVLAGRLESSRRPGRLLTLGLLLGAGLFVGLILALQMFGTNTFTIGGAWAVWAVEIAMSISIALTLVLLFTGSMGLKIRRP